MATVERLVEEIRKLNPQQKKAKSLTGRKPLPQWRLMIVTAICSWGESSRSSSRSLLSTCLLFSGGKDSTL